MHRPLSLLLMALLSLSLLSMVSVLLLAPGQDAASFFGQIHEALLLMLVSSGLLSWFKRKGRIGGSRLIGAASVLLILTGPIALGTAWAAGLDLPEFCKVGFCSLLVYAAGCLLYWLSLEPKADLYRPV